ncbi:MAG: hypothetical protein K2X48_19705 [Chitinophagaceae bacterium]|nr:hypothetical protein [Chitinophagaceae bacterium]
MKRALTLALVIAALATSCKKKDETKTETKTDILAKSAWTVDSYGVDVNNDLMLTGVEDETKPCDRDNTYSFSANGTLVRNNGSLKCSSEPNTDTGNWQFYLNETKLDIFGNTYFIKTLTSNRLELYSPGPASNAIFILKR